jgi:Replication-relaxation
VAIIERYRFVPTSQLVRLMPGDQKNNHRHLQTLYHHGLINRFCLPKYGGPGEFIYYLDSSKSLETLREAGLLGELAEVDRRRREEVIRLNRESKYTQLHRDDDVQGKVLFIKHELMVSRFHAVLELACRKLAGRVFLEQWKQGPELYSRVEVPTVRPLRRDETTGRLVWEEQSKLQYVPHRPDAFFTLYFPSKPEGRQRTHFFYEADRETENTTRYKMKLRAHYHFIVKQQRQRQHPYNVPAIAAVLTETTSKHWAEKLRDAAKENVVSPKPYSLFWFTSLDHLAKPAAPGRPPLYLEQPEEIFKRIWQSPAEEKPFNLAD